MKAQRILIVEDNPMNMELATDLLEVAGFTVLPAMTAEEGLVLAGTEQPDLILMDIGLPGMDGLEATRRLKQNRSTASIPVVAVSASVMSGDEAKAFAAGCCDYISRPIDTRQFAKIVASHLAAQPHAESES